MITNRNNRTFGAIVIHLKSLRQEKCGEPNNVGCGGDGAGDCTTTVKPTNASLRDLKRLREDVLYCIQPAPTIKRRIAGRFCKDNILPPVTYSRQADSAPCTM